MSSSQLCKARSSSVPRGRARLYPVTESIPTSFTPEITGRLGTDTRLLRAAEWRGFFFFLFFFLLMPLAFSLLVFTTRLLLPGTFNSTSLKRFRAHAKCQDAQLLQDAQMCDFDGITLRTRWWNVKEKSSHFHGTPVHPRPKPGAAEHQPALS